MFCFPKIVLHGTKLSRSNFYTKCSKNIGQNKYKILSIYKILSVYTFLTLLHCQTIYTLYKKVITETYIFISTGPQFVAGNQLTK